MISYKTKWQHMENNLSKLLSSNYYILEIFGPNTIASYFCLITY